MPKHVFWLVLVVSIIPVQAQTSRMSVVSMQAQPPRWENLDQIHRGTKIEVVEQSLKSISGKFVRVSQDDLGLTPWLAQPVKTLFAVRCKTLDRLDYGTAF